ncbi:YslB family protein [Priestia filamentosa]|uniref:YslB family protein n=1 Tax=Priestia filamentosa TaxID=1402861 RepID=UPI001FB55B0A|nr:YslB family protein [Priestia filamentosa]
MEQREKQELDSLEEVEKEEERPSAVTHEETIPLFGYELLRDIVLPDILGKEIDNISYWAGKNIARLYPQPSLADLQTFFIRAGWGTLTLKKEQRSSLEFELSGPSVERRLHNKETCSFQLEAGFLAEQIQAQKGYTAEAEQWKKHRNKVVLSIVYDRRDILV